MSHRFRPPTIRETEQPSTREPNAAPILSPLVAAGAITSSQMAVSQTWQPLTGNFTTTLVNTWSSSVIASFVDIPPGSHALFVGVQMAAKANMTAGFDIEYRVVLYTGRGAGDAYVVLHGIFIPSTQNYYETTGATAMLNIPTNMPDVLPGERTMSLEIYTVCTGTGTTTVLDDNAKTFLYSFVVGDSSL